MRIFDILKTDLTSNRMKVEEEIERVINDKSICTDDKVSTIKLLLKESALLMLAFNQLESYIDTDTSQQ